MRVRNWLMVPAALVALGGCVSSGAEVGEDGEMAFLPELPEAVLAVAAPTQNLQAVRIESDGCYWYLHSGPVENTMLPLRTVEGRPICTRPQNRPVN